MKNNNLVEFILRIGISSVFIYAAVSATINPGSWIGYLPQYLKDIFPQELLLKSFSVYELILGIWLLTGLRTFYAAIVSSITLLGIIFTNLGILDITFRDIAIFFSAIALTVSSSER